MIIMNRDIQIVCRSNKHSMCRCDRAMQADRNNNSIYMNTNRKHDTHKTAHIEHQYYYNNNVCDSENNICNTENYSSDSIVII